VTVKDAVARLDSNGALAGSTLTMDTAFLNLINKFGFSIPEAVAATSTRASHKAGLHDVGSISVGKKADFIELTADRKIRSFS
jgi:N-acetylglucosamine-6-phosphate deacetylase